MERMPDAIKDVEIKKDWVEGGRARELEMMIGGTTRPPIIAS
jgi:hypothetical protein